MGEGRARLVALAGQRLAPFSPAPFTACTSFLLLHTLTRTTSDPNRFTNKWKARLRHPGVPPEALPPALKRAFDAGEVAKERFRRASSLGPELPPLSTGSKVKVTPF